jgi:hypothetical protein
MITDPTITQRDLRIPLFVRDSAPHPKAAPFIYPSRQAASITWRVLPSLSGIRWPDVRKIRAAFS